MDDVAQFCRDVYPRLARGLGAQCGDHRTGEDLAQEALARAWERWSKVRSHGSPEAWVWRVGLNLAASQRRRQAVERRARARMTASDTIHDADVADVTALRGALATIPTRQRAAVVLRYIGDLSVTDTASALGCAPGTVKALTSQGLDRLRDALGANEAANHG